MHKISILKRTAFLLILNFANSGMASSLEAIGLGDANNPSYLPSLAGLSADGSTLVGKYNLAQNPEDIFTAAFLFGKDSKIQIFDASECDINPTAISANGSVVVGYWADTDSSNYQAFRWTSAGGLQELGALTEGGFSEAQYVSSDGSVVVGDSDAEDGNRYAYRWTQAGGMVSLGALAAGGNSLSYGISADGSVVIGFSDNGDGNQHAFRWTASQGMMNLGVLPGGRYSQATAVSDDGKVVVGISEMGDGNVYAFRWTQEKGMQILGTLEGALGLLPIDISADGSVVIGNTTDGFNNSAFRWTASEGIKSLGKITNELYSSVQGISSDGSVVVGDAADTDGNVYAFRWTSTTGIQTLDTFLTTLGLDVSDWDFAGNAMGNLILVSADGQTISGLGYYSKDGQPALNGFEAIYFVRSAKRATTINSSPIASTITYGQTLASSTLSGGSASVAGRFAWTTPSTAPAAGTSSYSVTFTPNDTANYNTVTRSVSVTVNKATPTIIVAPTGTAMTYGQTLASSTLSGGSASVAGNFSWTTPSTAPAAGTSSYSVTFTPNDTANYNTVTRSVSVTVNKATPVINATPTASRITYGQTLASFTLSGGAANVAGNFSWTTPSTAPAVGTTVQNVTFTPTDTANYNTVATTVSVLADPSISSNLSAVTITLGANYSYQITGSGSPTSFQATGLPKGLSVNRTSGQISGAPTQTGTFSVTLRALKGRATLATAVKVVNVVQVPTFSYATRINAQRNKNVNVRPKVAGSPAPSFSVVSGSLPPGLSLNASTAAITGKPTTAGSYAFTVRGSNSAGNTDRSTTIVVK